MDNQHRNNLERWEVFKENPRYEVSDHGNVRFSSTGVTKYQCENAQGYLVIQYKILGTRYTKKVHRMVAETFLKPPSKELVEKCSKEHWKVVLVKHLDNNKKNNHYQNLEWSDLKGNTKQAWDDSLIIGLKGSENGRAKLTEEVVEKMCRDFQEGMMPKEAVAKYGCSVQQATKIRAGIQWKHVWCKYNIIVNRRDRTIND